MTCETHILRPHAANHIRSSRNVVLHTLLHSICQASDLTKSNSLVMLILHVSKASIHATVALTEATAALPYSVLNHHHPNRLIAALKTFSTPFEAAESDTTDGSTDGNSKRATVTAPLTPCLAVCPGAVYKLGWCWGASTQCSHSEALSLLTVSLSPQSCKKQSQHTYLPNFCDFKAMYSPCCSTINFSQLAISSACA